MRPNLCLHSSHKQAYFLFTLPKHTLVFYCKLSLKLAIVRKDQCIFSSEESTPKLALLHPSGQNSHETAPQFVKSCEFAPIYSSFIPPHTP